MASQLEPMAFEVEAPRSMQPPSRLRRSGEPRRSSRTTSSSVGERPQRAQSRADSADSAFNVLLRFASLPAVVDAQIAQTLALISAAIKGPGAPKHDQREGGLVIDGDEERTFWREHATRLWDEPGAIVRASWLPAEIAAVFGALDVAMAQARCAPPTLIGRAAVGSGLVRIDGDEAAQARAIDALRRSRHLGNVVIVRGSPALKALVDVWGSMGDRRPLLDSLKRAFDPNGVLNAGRGPL
jgi:hypothetical protein